MKPKMVILASASPRRKDLLTSAGIPFFLCPSGADESFERADFETAAEITLELAARKARIVSWQYPGRIVLGADTLVEADDGEILGQPADRMDARRMIGKLSGRTHKVHTAVAICRGSSLLTEVDTVYVKFKELSAEEMDRYVHSGEGDDKAGAYAYQGFGSGLVAEIQGDPQTVIGLPIRIVKDLLARLP